MTNIDEQLQKTELWLIRHGESTSNRDGQFQGWGQSPLSPLGQAQAARLAEYLHGRRFHALYSSDLARAKETAKYLSATLDVLMQKDEQLRELDFGDWSGLTANEIAEQYPEEWTEQPRFDPARRRGGGESFYDLQARVVPALTKISQRHPGERVLVVSHGGVIRAYVAHLLGIPLSEMWHMTIDNTAVTRVQPYAPVFDSDSRPGKVLSLNETHHLDGFEFAEENYH